jgi:hypothetical protein
MVTTGRIGDDSTKDWPSRFQRRFGRFAQILIKNQASWFFCHPPI